MAEELTPEEKYAKLTPEEKGKQFLRYSINYLRQKLTAEGVISIDSNYYHFVIHHIVEKFPELKKIVPFGWYYHGPYCEWIDDILIADFGMDPKFHQLKSTDPDRFTIYPTTYEEGRQPHEKQDSPKDPTIPKDL